MKINNGFNILPWYDSLEKQNCKKWYAYGQAWPLLCPQGFILPFQFISDTAITISSNIYAISVETGQTIDLGVKPTVTEIRRADITYYIVKLVSTSIVNLPIGRYNLRMNTSEGFLYSEELVVINNANDCIKVEYWNEDTLKFTSGEINFTDNFHFIFYINSTIGKPEYEFEEELTKRLGYKFIESQTSNKVYKFSFVAPEYICDAMRLIRMCDYIKLTTKFDSYNALSFAYEPKWQEQGDLAAVDVEFDTDCIIQKLESFNRRAKESFYNALLADIDEPVLFSTDTVAQYYTEYTTSGTISGKLIRQLTAISEDELVSSLSSIVLPVDNQSDNSQVAKKAFLSDIVNKLIPKVNLSEYLLKSVWDKVFEIRTDRQGKEYIFGKLPVVTQYGITMYADGGAIDLPSLYTGLPIDGKTLIRDEKGVLMVNPDIELGGGVSNFWDLSGIPSWIGSSKPKYSYSEIEGTPDLSNYALRSDVTLVSEKLNDFLEGSDTDNIINKWKELEVFLNGLSESDNLATILSSKVGKDYVDGTFVTLSTTQSILAEKDFVGGLKVNGSPIYYDTEKKYWKLEGDLLVTGGVTMYGSDSSFTPSTIMDAILYDSATLGINSNGQLYVKGGTSGGGLDITALQNYLTQNSYLNVTSGDNRYLKLSGGMITGENDQVPLAISNTASTLRIGFVRNNEVLGYLGFIEANKPLFYDTDGNGRLLLHERNYSSYALPLTGGRIVGKLQIQRTPSNIAFYNADNVLWGHIGFNAANNAVVWDRSGANEYEILHRGNYSYYALPLSGGTITGELHVSSTSTNRAIIRLFSAADVPNDLLFGTNGEYHWSITSRNIEEGRYIGLYNNKEGSNGWVFKANYDTRVLDFMNTPTVNGNTIWHSDNDGSGSGLDADLLDGKHLSEIIRYEGYSNKNANKADIPQTITYWAENGGYGSTYGTALNIQGAGSWNNRIAFRTDGKIDYYQGINTGDMSYIGQLAFTSSNVASATKLQTARTIWGQSFDGTGNVSGDIGNTSAIAFDTSRGATNIGYLWTNTKGMHMDMSGLGTEQQGTNFTLTSSGNVGIGTPNPSAKFQVNGNAAIYSSSAGVISLYRTVSDGGSYVDYYPLNQTSQKWRVGAGSVDEFFYEAADGSNLARICHHATKGTRLEVGKRFLSVQPSGSDADRSVITLISNGDSPTDFIMGSGNYAWSITSRNSAEGHLLGFYSALSGQYAMRVYKEGNVLVTGGITMYSDKRKKTILNHVELSLKQIADAPLIEHYYNGDDKRTTHVGSIAQYWAEMNDWFCKLDSEGYYTMEIQNAALASAISIARELVKFENETDKRIRLLEAENKELRNEIERLKRA